MKVIREKPCQRLHHRVTAPLRVTLETGESLFATNWSLGGLRLDGLASLPPVSSTLKLVLELPFQGFDISFDVRAEVVRHANETGTIGVKFIELSERTHDLMSHFIDDLVRGKMASIDDTICRIDIPVTPISTKPDANPGNDVPAKRLPIKTIVFSAFYIIFGLAVFAYLAFLFYVNIMRLEVSSAVVSAPLYSMDMPMDGRFMPANLHAGMEVKKGQKIAEIVNLKLESKIDELTVTLEERRRGLFRAKEKYRIEQNRLKIFQIIKTTDGAIIKAEEEAVQEMLAAADKNVERMKLLFEKGLVERHKRDKAIQKRSEVEAKLENIRRKLAKFSATQAVSNRKHFGENNFALDLDLLALEVEKANSALRLASMELEKLESKRHGLMLKAPYDGRIASLQVSHDAVLPKGRHLLTLEKSIRPEVTAFLDQSEIVYIGMHDEADIYIPSIGKHIKGKVLAINRNAPQINQNASHYTWYGEDQKTASVRLVIVEEEGEIKPIQAGMPAVVTFSKRASNNAYSVFTSDLTGLEM